MSVLIVLLLLTVLGVTVYGKVQTNEELSRMSVELARINGNYADLARDAFHLLEQVRTLEVKMTEALQALADQVRASVEIEQSAVTLIKGLADRITEAGTDPAALAELATDLHASADALAAAVRANTAADTPPPAADSVPAAPDSPAPASDAAAPQS